MRVSSRGERIEPVSMRPFSKNLQLALVSKHIVFALVVDGDQHAA